MLQDLQLEWLEILFSHHPIEHAFICPDKNIAIYRHQMMEKQIQLLQTVYPCITLLIGVDCFRMTAKEYIMQYPCQTPNLHQYGEFFSHFVLNYVHLKNLPYLHEIARFEWSFHTLAFAQEPTPLDIQALKSVSTEEYGHLRFNLHPALALHQFQYPVLRIIDLCKKNNDEQIDLAEGGEYLLMIRLDDQIKVSHLTQADYCFLKSLQDGNKLKHALDEALAIDSSFSLIRKLPEWIQHKVIVDFILHKSFPTLHPLIN